MEAIFVVYLTTLTVLCSGQSVLEPPVNSAQHVGNEVRLNCSATLGTDVLEWRHFLEGGTGIRIWDTRDSGQPDDTRFEIEREGDNYDLIIRTVTMEEAGKYVCRLVLADIEAEAEVVVLDNFGCEPFIALPPYEPDPPKIIEDVIMMFTCSVQGDGYKAPALEWWNMNGQVNSDYNFDPDTNTATAMANLTATGEMDMMHFECRLFFEREDGEADEPPRYEDMCISYYEVEHAPQNIEISPNPDAEVDEILNLYTGDHVNCTASGNPEPTYGWYEKDLGDVSFGSRLIITPDMVPDNEDEVVTWVCQAKNTIGGNERQSLREVKMNIKYRAPDEGESTGTEGWKIAVATVIPLLIIISVVIVVVFLYMRKKKMDGGGGGGSGGSELKKPPKDYDNHSGPDRHAPDEPGPPSRAPIQGGPAVNPYPGGRPQGGVPVMPITQQGYPGKASPGYADLGVKQLGGSGNPSLNSSQASLQVNQFMGDERQPPQRQTPSPQQQAPPTRNSGYSNVGYEPTNGRPQQPQQYPPAAAAQQYPPAAAQQYPQYHPPQGTDTSV